MTTTVIKSITNAMITQTIGHGGIKQRKNLTTVRERKVEEKFDGIYSINTHPQCIIYFGRKDVKTPK